MRPAEATRGLTTIHRLPWLFGATNTVGTKTFMPRAWWVARAMAALNPAPRVPSLPADGATTLLLPAMGMPRHWRAEGATLHVDTTVAVPLPLAATLATSHNAKPPTVGSGWGLVDEQSALWGAEDGDRRWLHFQHPLGRNARGMFSMADYTIAAIPTLYRSRLYRSRLEARWAAFFDRLGWTHEYEPFDLGAWSPDFAITNPFDALIEIKPITEPDPDLFMRVQGAAGKQVAFVTRVAPTIDKGFVWFGWWAYSGAGAGILWLRDETEPSFRADIYSHSRDRKTWVTCTVGKGASEDGPYGWSYGDYTMGLWADACNAVQWEPVR